MVLADAVRTARVLGGILFEMVRDSGTDSSLA